MIPSEEKRTRSVGTTLYDPMRVDRQRTAKNVPFNPTSFQRARSATTSFSSEAVNSSSSSVLMEDSVPDDSSSPQFPSAS